MLLTGCKKQLTKPINNIPPRIDCGIYGENPVLPDMPSPLTFQDLQVWSVESIYAFSKIKAQKKSIQECMNALRDKNIIR